MIQAESIDFHSYLPPYRSLLSPNVRYDYEKHSLIPIKENELRALSSINRGVKSTTKSKIKMKYKSLLCDVSKRTSILSLRLGQVPSNKVAPINIKNLPWEILAYIFELVDSHESYLACSLVCKQFYQVVKPLIYENLYFTSTYRFAQFITYLRINSEVGQYVKTIDLSQIKQGEPIDYDEDEERDLDITVSNGSHGDNDSVNSKHKILAGWRDWKYKSNPLYSIQPCINLSKVNSNSQVLSKSSKTTNSTKMLRFSKTLKYFKPKKRQKLNNTRKTNRSQPQIQTLNLGDRRNNSHPLINKFLMNYSTSKDLPIGYILHMINLCPNITSLNLGNLSLSTDYEISRSTMYKYRTFDLINNYPKDLVRTIDGIMASNSTLKEESLNSFNKDKESYSSLSILNANDSRSQHFQAWSPNPASSASSVYSVAFAKPIFKYNSLLPPLPSTVHDLSYMSKGDGKVYLSDLNLKSINGIYLSKLDEDEVLRAIVKVHGHSNPNRFNRLKYVNLSSMIWLTSNSTQWFLNQILGRSIFDMSNYSDCESAALASNTRIFSDDESIYSESENKMIGQDLIIDLSDSGMYKNLGWAKLIDLNESEGCRLALQIIKNDVHSAFDEYMIRERRRRGRIGENYLS